MPDLQNCVAVVTGAAHGIGRALALTLREKGCHLALADIDESNLAVLAHELRASGSGQRISVHVADVSDRLRMGRLAAEVLDAHRSVNVLINSAGVAHEAAFLQTSFDDWDRVVGVNLMGVIYSCHAFLPHLARADRAHVVNLSSLLGIVAMPGQCAYSTSKFAVRGFSEALQEELRATSIGLTVVHPGAVASGMMRRARGDDPELLQRIDAWYERHAMPPARAAARIVRAIERGTPRVVIGPDARFADLLKRLMPVAGNRRFVDLALRLLGVEDMRAKRSRQWNATVGRGEKAP